MSVSRTWLFLVLAVALLCAGSLSSFTYVPIVVALSLAIVANLVKPGCGFLAEESEAKNSGLEPSSAGVRSARHSRAHWIDKLKVVLTCLVVAHHCTCVMSGGGWDLTLGHYSNPLQLPFSLFLVFNQSYFMCLFFFVAGYFAPSSFDRKGPRAFLRDKMWRLGLPFLVYTFGVGPALNVFVQRVLSDSTDYDGFNMSRSLPKGYNKSLVGKPGYRMPTHVPGPVPATYEVEAGPCWFLLWLLMFHTAYAAVMLGAEDESRGATAAAAATMASSPLVPVKSTPASISG